MLKKSLLTLALMSFMGFAAAQNLTVLHNGQSVEEGTTFICSEGEDIFDFEFQVKNNSEQEVTAIFGMDNVSVPEGGMTYFCFGNCYAPGVTVSNPVALPANSVTEPGTTSCHYMPNEAEGAALVKCSLYEENNPNEVFTFFVHFNTQEAVNSNMAKAMLSNAYPNPASDEVRFDVNCNGNASLAIYNLLGQEVLNSQVENGQVVFSVANLNEGIYFCNLTVNGQVVKTEKFVVKK